MREVGQPCMTPLPSAITETALAQNGATFGGSVIKLREAALDANMPLMQFVDLVGQNSQLKTHTVLNLLVIQSMKVVVILHQLNLVFIELQQIYISFVLALQAQDGLEQI